MSLVGPPSNSRQVENLSDESLFLGKPGLCGLIQLHHDGALSDEEINQYTLYYARNQNVLLDLEILIKTWMQSRKMKNSKKRN